MVIVCGLLATFLSGLGKNALDLPDRFRADPLTRKVEFRGG